MFSRNSICTNTGSSFMFNNTFTMLIMYVKYMVRLQIQLSINVKNKKLSGPNCTIEKFQEEKKGV